jgi:hypothetical protein
VNSFIAIGLGVGPILALLALGAALSWLGWRSLKGREVQRRVIFALIWVAVSVPIIFPITFENPITPVARAVFDQVENLPDGSKVLISFDFDPAMAPEIGPMANAVTRHCFAKGHKVVFMSIWGTGPGLLRTTLDNVVRPEFPERKEGIDWANIGYKAGNQGVLNVIVTDLRKMYPADINNVPLDSLPVLNGIRSCKDFNLIIALGGGFPGPKEWVLYVGDPGNVPVVAGAAAVTAPQLYPYYPKQLLGILGGIKGAAEYEQHLADVYPRFADTAKPAVKMMGPQTLAHVVVMIFIVIGNIIYFRGRREARKT